MLSLEQIKRSKKLISIVSQAVNRAIIFELLDDTYTLTELADKIGKGTSQTFRAVTELKAEKIIEAEGSGRGSELYLNRKNLKKLHSLIETLASF